MKIKEILGKNENLYNSVMKLEKITSMAVEDSAILAGPITSSPRHTILPHYVQVKSKRMY